MSAYNTITLLAAHLSTTTLIVRTIYAGLYPDATNVNDSTTLNNEQVVQITYAYSLYP